MIFQITELSVAQDSIDVNREQVYQNCVFSSSLCSADVT